MTTAYSARERAYQALRARILNLELEPNECLNDKELAQQLADGWMEQGESLKALGVTTAKISFDLRDSPEGPLVFELPLGGA